LFQTVGSSPDPAEFEFLISKGKKIIATHGGLSILLFGKDKKWEFVNVLF
jgi:hypothetical protein